MDREADAFLVKACRDLLQTKAVPNGCDGAPFRLGGRTAEDAGTAAASANVTLIQMTNQSWPQLRLGDIVASSR